jgi:predicted small metal-binding protein
VQVSLGEEEPVGKILNCECGVTVRGETDDEVVERALEHLRALHPDIAESITREQVLAMCEEE